MIDFSGLAHHQELDKSQEIPWDSGPRFTNPLILCRLSRLFLHDPGCLGSTFPCASGLQSAVPDQLWKNQPVDRILFVKSGLYPKTCCVSPSTTWRARLWSFEAPKNVPISNYSTTATGIPPTLSEPRMCQAMQACQIQGHMSTGGLGSIDASTICQ